jgi:pimeloyl-ACP methyl ester carboxylesterase
MNGASRLASKKSTLVIVLMLTVSVAYAGGFKKLRPANEVPTLHDLILIGESLPRQYHAIETAAEGEPSQRIVIEVVGEGDEDAEEIIVMIHGILSDRRTWRFMAADLGTDHLVMLVDLLGSGDSDKPRPKKLDADAYGPTEHARRVLRALRTFVPRSGGPDRIVLVGHSLGGAVILRMLGDEALVTEYADVVDRVDRAVLLAPMDFAIEKIHPKFLQVAKLGQFEVDLGAALGILRKKVARTTLESYYDPSVATREDAQRLLETLRHKKSRRPNKAGIKNAIPYNSKTKRPDWDAIERLVADYDNVQVPCLILWGERDETLPVAMGYKLKAQLPNARLRIIEKSMHSLQQERPRLSASLVRDFVRTSGNGWDPIGELDPDRFVASDLEIATGDPERVNGSKD